MGANHTTLASVSNTSIDDDSTIELEGGSLSNYGIDQHLVPGSGRMTRTIRLKHKVNSSMIVLKTLFVTKENSSIVIEQQKELQRIVNALKEDEKSSHHVVPFLYWNLGPYKQRGTNSVTNPPTRQISLIRPYLYTTLSDRLVSRPFLAPVEKLWIVYQLLDALQALHSKKIVHGFLTAENVGLTSWNWVVLVDISSYKARTALPDDDPSEYLYYFQEHFKHGTDTTPREKRCYLAPERFYTPNLGETDHHHHMQAQQQQQQQKQEQHHGTATSERRQPPLTPAMDIFSAGCVIMETFLNGERAFDLGDLMEYRKRKSSSTLQQRLSKIEFSAIRAACRHMLHLDANQRLSAKEYLERLRASELVPNSFEQFASIMERITYCPPDARLAVAGSCYETILWETLGLKDMTGTSYSEKALGSTMMNLERKKTGTSSTDETNSSPTVKGDIDAVGKSTTSKNQAQEEKKEDFMFSTSDLLAQTEALLKKLETLSFGGTHDEVGSTNSSDKKSSGIDEGANKGSSSSSSSGTRVKRSHISKSSLLIYLQLILATIRHVQRPASKLVALQLIEQVGKLCSDEAKLQRILPVTISMLQDQDPLVRASAIRVLASTVSIIDTFPPSDSKIFSQYIFKRVAHLITDPTLVVRLAFAKNIAILAESSQRFLDISHAVRLYEAVGGGSGTSGTGGSGGGTTNVAGGGTGASGTVSMLNNESRDMSSTSKSIFADDVTKLLDGSSGSKGKGSSSETSKKAAVSTTTATASSSTTTTGTTITKTSKSSTTTGNNMESTKNPEGLIGGGVGKTLIGSTYNSDLAALHETVSRWVVHITTDQSEHSSPAKRALLADMSRLCTFFGLDGVMGFILPQILSFLNDRKDWQLRASLFEHLPSVCHIIGKAATEHFVLPCLEIALVDEEEPVIVRALQCLSELLRLGLLSRSLLLGGGGGSSTATILQPSSPSQQQQSGGGGQNSDTSSSGLLKKYGALLLHPSADIRYFTVSIVTSFCQTLGHPDATVFLLPLLVPFLRFEPSANHLSTREGLEACLKTSWSRSRFQEELNKILAVTDVMSPTSGQWTSIGFGIREHDEEGKDDKSKKPSGSGSPNKKTSSSGGTTSSIQPDSETEQVRVYLKMLARSRTRSMKSGTTNQNIPLNSAIEGSLKLAQHIKFPRQDTPGLPASSLPQWYAKLRENLETKDGQEEEKEYVPEFAAIRSVSALGEVYGLSIMDQSAGSASSEMTTERAKTILQSDESRRIEAACTGEWGSETCLDPSLSDTSLLITKLNALQVPPLPPKLAEEKTVPTTPAPVPTRQSARDVPSTNNQVDWKPKIDTLVATSKCAPDIGHTAPIVRLVVSHDQRFFVTGSHDGTCRVWELDKAEKCNGILKSSINYKGHISNDKDGGNNTSDKNNNAVRINDLAMVEGGHSVVSAASDGSVHVWRVDMVSSSMNQSTNSTNNNSSSINNNNSSTSGRDVSRAVGSSQVRTVNPNEGEVLAVNHFNTPSASIMTFATQKGYIHSWDLRCASEPFLLKNPQDTGYITSMAMGGDRNWLVTGTSRGFVALWDLRFHQVLQLWHHSRSAPVNRLATSFVPPPQSWAGKGGHGSSNTDARPFIFVACGPNECGMFDITTGACRECFRTIDYGSRLSTSNLDDVPRLYEVPLSTSARRKVLGSQGLGSRLGDVVSSSFQSVNAMVGSIGASDHSFLITGGSDCRIRFWDFAVPSKCYVSSGLETVQPRPSFERVDSNQACRLMICRQPPSPSLGEMESSRMPRKLFQGMKKPESYHHDSIQDLKVVRSGLLSCSRDSTVKLWR